MAMNVGTSALRPASMGNGGAGSRATKIPLCGGFLRRNHGRLTSESSADGSWYGINVELPCPELVQVYLDDDP